MTPCTYGQSGRTPSLFALATKQQREAAATAGEARAARLVADAARPSEYVRLLLEDAKPDERNNLGMNGKTADTADGQKGGLLSSRGRRFRMQRHAQRLIPGESVAQCHLQRSFSASNVGGEVTVVKRQSGSVAYRGVTTCGSVWHCPVCANKIAERRREELQNGIDAHRIKGGRVYMLTQTIPHTVDMPLRDTLSALSTALRAFTASRQWRTVREVIQFKGSVRALEVTHGENGWHPHAHVLVFADGDQEAVLAALETLRDYWAKAVRKAGLGQINQHGFKVGGADHAAEYVSKFGDTEKAADGGTWDVSREMTRQHAKLARRKGRTPFALLHDSMNGDAQAGALFVEYAHEFKGKRQLYYSPGLKDYLGLDDLEDADIAAEDQQDAPGEESQVIWHLDKEEWGLIVSFNKRGEFLDTAARYGTDGCYLFLKALKLRRSDKAVKPRFYYPEYLQ